MSIPYLAETCERRCSAGSGATGRRQTDALRNDFKVRGVRSATIKANPGFRRDRLRASVKLACDQSEGKVRDSANELDSFETSIGAIHTKSNNLVS
jgi:hypothetical protein